MKSVIIAIVSLIIAGNIFAVSVGQPAPDISAQHWINSSSQNLNINSFKGNVLVLEFFATWCPHCQSSVPTMENLYNKYKSDGVAVVALSDEAYATVNNFVQLYGIEYIVGSESSSRNDYGVVGVPTVFVIDDKGIITWIGSPETDQAALDQAVADAVDAMVTAPVGVGIITPDTTVPNNVTQYTINGTNDSVVGTMTWANKLTGSGESFPATNNWSIDVNLGVGGNLITVTGTNIYGDEASDSVTINRAIPPYTDNSFNRGLIHCDESVTNQWPNSDPDCFLTPDDNSSGRLAVSPIMNASNDWGIARDDSTMPTFETNSPYGGDYLAFDGNDSIIVTNAWPGGDNMDIDLNFRFNGLPPLSGDNYMGVFITYPVKTYIQNIDNVHGKILMIVYDMDVNPHFFWSNKVLSPNVWYRLSFSVSNNNVKVIVGNDGGGYVTNTTTVPSLLQPAITDIIIGDSYFVPSRLFQGDMDEIRWGIVVPEPFTFGFIGLLGLLAFRK